MFGTGLGGGEWQDALCQYRTSRGQMAECIPGGASVPICLRNWYKCTQVSTAASVRVSHPGTIWQCHGTPAAPSYRAPHSLCQTETNRHQTPNQSLCPYNLYLPSLISQKVD
eukprot:147273-Rhodomonas_salina.1